MSTTQTLSTAVSIGVPSTAHSVTTTCPACQHAYTVVLAADAAESTVLQSVLTTLGELSSGQATYRTPSWTEGKRLLSRSEAPATVMDPSTSTSGITRARYCYFAADRRRNKSLLSPPHLKVYRVVERMTVEGAGARAADLRMFPHDTVQQALRWLVAHRWVRRVKASEAQV